MDKQVIITAIWSFKRVLEIAIFIRIILSWFRIDRNNVLYNLLLDITEPILSPIRKLLYKSPLGGPGMMLDFSPVIAYALLELVFNSIIRLLT